MGSQASLVYLNGILTEEHKALLSIQDRRYLYGEGLFETLKASQGLIPFLEEHLSRFIRGIKLLNYDFKISRAKLEFILYQTLMHNQLKQAYLRLSLSRNTQDFNMLTPSVQYNLSVIAKPIQDTSIPEHYATLIYPDYKIFPNRFCQVKGINFFYYLKAKEYAEKQNYEEALLLNHKGNLVEGSTHNLFLFKDNRWQTPALNQGPLPGITRKVLINLMKKNKIPIVEQALSPQDLKESDEAFLCNAIKGIVPLIRFEKKTIGLGKIGSHTQKLQALFKDEIQYRIENFKK